MTVSKENLNLELTISDSKSGLSTAWQLNMSPILNENNKLGQPGVFFTLEKWENQNWKKSKPGWVKSAQDESMVIESKIAKKVSPRDPKKSFPKKGNPGRFARTIILKSGWALIALLGSGAVSSPVKIQRYPFNLTPVNSKIIRTQDISLTRHNTSTISKNHHSTLYQGL